MSKGYLIIAQNNSTVDYVKQSYLLAKSIKATQTINKVCLITDKKPNYDIFDDVVILDTDSAINSEWKIDNKWQIRNLSPYDETVLLDSDMIFPNRDLSHWWEYMGNFDICGASHVMTFRNEIANDDFYRKVFRDNKLPNVYTAFFYFKKNTEEFFNLVEDIFKNKEYYSLLKNPPEYLSGDVVFALAAKILGIEFNHDVLTFCHMKAKIQGVESLTEENWSTQLPSRIYEKNIYINNFIQMYPFHYHDKTWLTNNLIEKLENNYN